MVYKHVTCKQKTTRKGKTKELPYEGGVSKK